MPSTVELRFLGPIDMRKDGLPLRGFESRKAIAVLAYLATIGLPVSRCRLVSIFWPDFSELRGRSNLSVVLNNLVHVLPNAIQADRHSLWYQPSPDIDLDTATFTDLVSRGTTEALFAATQCYRATFLDGFYLDGCPEFELWQVSCQEAWQQWVSTVFADLIRVHVDLGLYRTGISLTRRLLAIQPWCEETHRQMMWLLALDGQRSAALMQYRICRRILRDELAVEPTAETTRLYESLCRRNWTNEGLSVNASPSLLQSHAAYG